MELCEASDVACVCNVCMLYARVCVSVVRARMCACVCERARARVCVCVCMWRVYSRACRFIECWLSGAGSKSAAAAATIDEKQQQQPPNPRRRGGLSLASGTEGWGRGEGCEAGRGGGHRDANRVCTRWRRRTRVARGWRSGVGQWGVRDGGRKTGREAALSSAVWLEG